VRVVTVEDAWQRIVSWCEQHAPVTSGHLRAAPPAAALAAAEERCPRRWPDDLRRWYSLQDGVDWESANTPLPDWRILPLSELVEQSEAMSSLFEEDEAELVREGEQQEAGSIAFIYLPSFVAIGENIAACCLYVDTRPGPRFGCIADWDRDEGAISEPTWPSVSAMLEEVAAALETGQSCDGWRRTVASGVLAWELSDDRSASDQAWDRVYMMFHDFLQRRYARGEQGRELLVRGRDWNAFEYEVVDNLLSNVAFHNRKPVHEWPEGWLDRVRSELTELRSVLPLLPAEERAYFTFMAQLGDAVLTVCGAAPATDGPA
jgi:cell wall assembly regulator SMI1